MMPQHLFATLAYLSAVLLAVYGAVDQSDITCNQSGMCSVGKSKHYHSSVHTRKQKSRSEIDQVFAAKSNKIRISTTMDSKHNA